MLDLRDLQECSIDNSYDGRMGLRISSVFAILIGSAIGVFIPMIASRNTFIRMPWYVFFVAKFFGSGVIISTAFIHLLAEANESLSDPCLGGTLSEYPWAFAICLISLFALFLSELLAQNMISEKISSLNEKMAIGKYHDELARDFPIDDVNKGYCVVERVVEADPNMDHESYYTQLLNIFVLEFGILFHCVFVGLTLAVSGDEFITLYIVLVFHQMFEGFGLGARIAVTNFGKHHWTPWIFCIAFSLITPVSIAIGLGVRSSYPPGSRANLITSGVFDSISAGVLIYSGLIELMANEFIYSTEFDVNNGFQKKMLAFFIMFLGCALMSLTARWI